MNRYLAKSFVLAVALGLGLACSAILDFEVEVECWCGERWLAQIAGAQAQSVIGVNIPIAASDTSYTICTSQLEHLALEGANPQDPLYLALRDSLESGAIANCELAGAMSVGYLFAGTDCASTGQGTVTTNITHVGACWETETLVPEAPEPCGLESQCGAYYDCADEVIVNAGDDEGGEGLLWACGPR